MKPFKRPWPVLFLCCVLTFNTMGMSFGMGAIFTDIMDTFGVSRATASLVQSVCIGVNFGSGVFTGHLLQRQGPRFTVITGSVLATAGCIIAFLATHIVQIIVGVGVLGGLGSSFIYLTTQILPGIIFHDMKSLALPIVSIAVAVGTAVYPPLYRHMIHHYSLRGTFLILAAINCQMILCGALIGLLAPWNPWKTAEPRKMEAQEADEADAAAVVDVASDEERRGNSHKSGDASEVKECRDGELVGFLAGVLTDHSEAADDDRLAKQRDRYKGGSHLEGVYHKDHENYAQYTHADRDSRKDSDTELLQEGIMTDPERTSLVRRRNSGENVQPLKKGRPSQDLPQEDSTHLAMKAEECELNPEEVSFLDDRNSGENAQPVEKESSSETNFCCCCCRDFSASSLQLDVLRDKQFVMFAVLGPSSYLFFTQPMMFMTDMVKSNQLTVEDGSVFLTVMFAGSVTGRILAGVLYRICQSRVPIVFSVAIATGGVTCLFYAFSKEYAHFVAVSLVFGIVYGVLSSSVPMTFLEILGPRRFAVGMGYMSTVGSISFLLAGPYGGTIRDLTNSYEPVYYVAIVHGLVFGILLIFIHLRYRHRS